MKRFSLIFLTFLILLLFPFKKAFAQPIITIDPATVEPNKTINITVSNLITNDPNTFYNINITYPGDQVTALDGIGVDPDCKIINQTTNWTNTSCSGNTFKATFDPTEIASFTPDNTEVTFSVVVGSPNDSTVFKNFTVGAITKPPPGSIFKIDGVFPNPVKEGQDVTISLSNITIEGKYGWQLMGGVIFDQNCSPRNNNKCDLKFKMPGGLDANTLDITVVDPKKNSQHISLDISTPTACMMCGKTDCIKNDLSGNPYCLKNCNADEGKTDPVSTTPKCKSGETCTQGLGCTPQFETNYGSSTRDIPCPSNPDKSSNLIKKGGVITGCKAVPTGLGISLPTETGALITTILGVILGIVGGIAIIIIIIAGYRLMVSQGNPEKIQIAKDDLTSAIIGFLFIIFSLVILQVIGYNILHIPGFKP